MPSNITAQWTPTCDPQYQVIFQLMPHISIIQHTVVENIVVELIIVLQTDFVYTYQHH